MWQGELKVVLLWRPGLRIVRERNQLGGAQDVERDIIGDGVHGDARRDQLQHKNENKYRGEKSAGCGNGERPEDVVEKDLGAIAHFTQAAWNVLGDRRLRGGNTNAYRQVRRRNSSRQT